MRYLLLVATLLLVVQPPASAASVATTPHFTASLAAESNTPGPGEKVALAITISPDPGWHTYWKNPGGTGLAPEFHWMLPAGVVAGPVAYPVPRELIAGGIASNVLTGRNILVTSLSLPTTMNEDEVLPVGLVLNLLVCSDGLCVPETTHLDLTLTTGNGAPATNAVSLFKAARHALAQPLSGEADYTVHDGTLTVSLPPISGNLANAHVFIANERVLPGRETFSRTSHGITVTMPAGKFKPGAALRGVIRVSNGPDVQGYQFRIAPHRDLIGDFWIALGGAILGGILLNLMPCVFPILSLKALTLAKAGGDELEARIEAIGYTAGAVGVLLILGGLVLAMKQAGHTVGWAFQLQDPAVVAILLLLTTAIATNLAGLYEIPSPAFAVGHRRGLIGGVATGALAAFIATPCTGPFMAGALGVALVLPAPLAMTVFAGLGFGLALPFLCLGFISPVRRLLPKPGHWMVTLRRLLSLPMFATTIGLLWIVGRESGVSAMTLSLAAAALLGVSLWWLGLRQLGGRRGYPILAPGIAAVILAVAAVQTSASTARAAGMLASQPYSASRLAALRNEGKPVFVFLTADWCLTCKMNEATSLSSTSVANAFAKAHVQVLEGDWTDGNPQVTQLLSAQGRVGVPLYLWYPVGGTVRQLPQVLTPRMLVKLAQSTQSSNG